MLSYWKMKLLTWLGWTRVIVDAYRVTVTPMRVQGSRESGAPTVIGYKLKLEKIDAKQSHIPSVEFTATIRSAELDRRQLEAALIDFFRSFGVDAVNTRGTTMADDTHEIFITVATFARRK